MSRLFVIQFALSCVLPGLFVAPVLANAVPTVKSVEASRRLSAPKSLKQIKQTEPEILQIPFDLIGTLTEGDEIIEAGVFNDIYAFTGKANQIIKIELSSEDFDTWVILLNDNGILGDNDDSNDSSNNSLVYQLPESGT